MNIISFVSKNEGEIRNTHTHIYIYIYMSEN